MKFVALLQKQDDSFDKQFNDELIVAWNEFEHWGELHPEYRTYNPQCFVRFFDLTLCNAYSEYIKTKNRAWEKNTKLKLGISFWATIVSAVATPVASLFDKRSVAVSFLVPLVIGIFTFLKASAKRREDYNEYRETWVRHSSRYHRLILALLRFHSSDRGEDNFSILVQSVFSILEKNLDQFEHNQSKNGLVGFSSHEEGKQS